MTVGAVVGLLVAILVLIILSRTIKIVRQAHAGIVERLGRYQRTLMPGLSIIIPFVDRMRPLIDMRDPKKAHGRTPVA